MAMASHFELSLVACNSCRNGLALSVINPKRSMEALVRGITFRERGIKFTLSCFWLCSHLATSPVFSAPITPYPTIALDCFYERGTEKCREALIYLEALQRLAASRGEYACQTRLLGLQADLIMVALDARRFDSFFDMHAQMKESCNDIDMDISFPLTQ